MKIETLQIKDLTPDPRNARKHGADNLRVLAESLKQFGQRKPIVISESGQVVAGNGTLEAAKKLGWLEIQAVRVPEDWTPEMIRAFAIADNRTAELSEFDRVILTEQLVELKEADFDLKALGFTETTVEDFSRISSAQVNGSTDALKEWVGMPDYDNEKRDHAYRTAVYFATEEDANNFFEVLGMKKAKVFWYPEFDGLIGSSINEQYVIEEE
jgi:hypothetical protein